MSCVQQHALQGARALFSSCIGDAVRVVEEYVCGAITQDFLAPPILC